MNSNLAEGIGTEKQLAELMDTFATQRLTISICCQNTCYVTVGFANFSLPRSIAQTQIENFPLLLCFFFFTGGLLTPKLSSKQENSLSAVVKKQV